LAVRRIRVAQGEWRYQNVQGDNSTRQLWPAPAAADWPALVCAKLNQNMSHQQWREWVSPDIGYIKSCPDLPVAPD
jgi:hypothetical protein